MLVRLLGIFLVATVAHAQHAPSPRAAEWWRLTTALSNDQMQGRDTGSEAYERAAQYVADQFATYGLKPAGDNGTWFQRVPMHEIDLDTANSSIDIGTNSLVTAGVPCGASLKLLDEATLSPREHLPASLEGDLVFTGYGEVDPAIDLHGKIAVFYNNTPAALSQAERETLVSHRIRSLTDAGAIALVSIDNPAAIEPFHWPAAYARTVTVGSDLVSPTGVNPPIIFRVSAEAAANLFACAGRPLISAPHPLSELLRSAAAGEPIPSGSLDARLIARLKITSKEISSPNVLAILPGSDPTLAPEYVALSAHLDGYGFGTPILGDNLYNGALDDAAYVATLLELAHKLTLPTAEKPRRSLLFCIFTGEEKGLLGSEYFTHHPTVPAQQIVADLNLDQLRPIFPLKILTMEGIADSTLGETARRVAATFDIELRPDREPERNLFRRADNYNFVRTGIPIASFIFGYNPGTAEERAYRNWYATRYHKPQDDLTTPIDWAAAVKFNDFYRALALAVADDPARPHWLPSSPYAPKAATASN
jgi:hypothetical protein